MMQSTCPVCHKPFRTFPSDVGRGKGKFCSRYCAHIGSNNPNWKGGIKKSRDRVLIYFPQHPYCTKKGYIRLSHLVMESFLERYIKPGEVVHHIDGNTLNDRKENLELYESRGKHTGFHNSQRGMV